MTRRNVDTSILCPLCSPWGHLDRYFHRVLRIYTTGQRESWKILKQRMLRRCACCCAKGRAAGRGRYRRQVKLRTEPRSEWIPCLAICKSKHEGSPSPMNGGLAPGFLSPRGCKEKPTHPSLTETHCDESGGLCPRHMDRISSQLEWEWGWIQSRAK